MIKISYLEHKGNSTIPPIEEHDPRFVKEYLTSTPEHWSDDVAIIGDDDHMYLIEDLLDTSVELINGEIILIKR